MRIDPSLGIVVMEFRDRTGAVATTLPTQRELDAYRSAQRRGKPEHQAPQPPSVPASATSPAVQPTPKPPRASARPHPAAGPALDPA